jgi:hypothetical protein
MDKPLNSTKSVLGTSIEETENLANASEVISYTEGKDFKDENNKLGGLISHIRSLYDRSKERRMSGDEQRWITAYQNYRGIYGPDVKFTDTEKSQAFIKLTKTKVNAAYSQIIDVLFAGSTLPIGIEPSPIPEGIAEAVYFDPQAKPEALPGGDKGDNGKQQKSASPRSSVVARADILEAVGPYREQLTRVQKDLKEGYGTTATAVTFEPADMAAKNMEKKIHDQLEESDFSKHLRSFAFDLSLYGTGVMKGPFAREKEYPQWDEEGNYKPLIKTVADVQYVSLWDIFPDPDARGMEDCEQLIERHRYSRSQLRALKKRPGFRKESIELAIEMGSNYKDEYWETFISDKSDQMTVDRYEVFEYWGVVDKKLAEEQGFTLPEELKNFDEVQINAWVCNDQILRLVLNPFTPARIPYQICPYEHNPYSIFGVGVAENMADTQLVMNGFTRLMIDNAVLSSNLIFEIDETNMVAGQDMKMYPGKVFRRQAGAPGQALFSTKFQNTTNECIAVFDKMRQLADEATGIPSYSHGQGGVQGIGRTASGMSMLMGAAAQNIKAVVRNIDDYLLSPLGKALFAFNMQFNFDKNLIGDLEVVARGTESLMRNEIRSQKLLQFLQLTANPIDAPYAKRDYLLRELASSLDLDPDKAVNDPREAAIQAKVLADLAQKMGAANPQGLAAQNGGQGGTQGAPSASNPSQTGAGNVAPGSAPEPGAQGFSSNGGTGGGNNPRQTAQPKGVK